MARPNCRPYAHSAYCSGIQFCRCFCIQNTPLPQKRRISAIQGVSQSRKIVYKLITSIKKNVHVHYIHTSHENDADRARRAQAFCLIKTVLRQQYIAFSISVLDEWEWMAKRLASLENVSFAVIPQPPYASTTRGTHIQPLSRQPKALFLISLVHPLQLRHLRSDQHLKSMNY